MALTDFLKERTVTKGSGVDITHTAIGDKDAKIYGGSYHISAEDEAEFYNMVYMKVVCGNFIEHLTEKQYETGIIYGDFDFHYSYECKQRMHNEEWLDELLIIYTRILKDVMHVTETPFNIYVMQKDNVNPVASKQITKDGIHIIITIICDRNVQMRLRELVMQDQECIALMKRLPLINSLDAVFDKGLTEGTTNVQVYGCRKPLHDAYKLTHHYEVEYDPTDGEPKMTPYHIVMDKQLFWELSVRNKTNRTEFASKCGVGLRVREPVNLQTHINVNLEGCTTEIDKLLAIIGSKRCGAGDHKLWVDVAQAIKNETKDAGLVPFVTWTHKYGTINKKAEAIEKYNQVKYTPKSFGTKRLGIGSLHFWARLDNPTAYNQVFASEKLNSIEPVVNKIEPAIMNTFAIIENAIKVRNDYAIADAFNTIYKGLNVCVDRQRKEYYGFNHLTKLWVFDAGGAPIRNALSTKFRDLFDNYLDAKETEGMKLEPTSDELEINKKERKEIKAIIRELGTTSHKNNILSEISDICIDVTFPSLLNRAEYLIPTNDGKVINMKTLEPSERTIEHKFSFVCNAKMIPFDASDKNFIKVREYFDALFSGNQETVTCVLNIIKSVFIGKPLRYIYFCIGEGKNGKSLLFKILNKIFGKFMDIISDAVIIEQKGNKSALNTEIEKLDKCRVAYVTELKETDKLNEKVIKQITGGDAINLRTLHTKDQTINPTCNAFILTNEFPGFNGEAKAVLDRMIIIPFKNTFAVNDDFEREMLAISDHIFTYIMRVGKLCDTFELSDEMIAGRNELAEENTDTSVQDYLEATLIACDETDKEHTLIKIMQLRTEYANYCLSHRLPCLSLKKFTAKVKQLGYKIKKNSENRLYGMRYRKSDELN